MSILRSAAYWLISSLGLLAGSAVTANAQTNEPITNWVRIVEADPAQSAHWFLMGFALVFCAGLLGLSARWIKSLAGGSDWEE
jgi:hypothetical protein